MIPPETDSPSVLSALGQPIDRIDGRLKVTGRAPYTYEHPVPNAVPGVLLTSSIAKGRIIDMDTSKAERAPGVLLVLTHKNAPRLPSLTSQASASPAGRIVQTLQDDVIRYANQPIALVVAGTFEQAQEAAFLIHVEYVVETHAVTMADRASQAKTPAKINGEPADSHRGDMQAGLAQGHARFSHVYRTPFEVHNPMEPHATIAVWNSPDNLTLYDTTQGVWSDRDRVAHLLQLKEENVRVISPFIGGGFGSKGPVWSHVIITALAAKMLSRPVKVACTRPQMFGMLGYRSETQQTIAVAAQADGSLTALSNDTLCLTSTFDEFVESAALTTRMLYAVDNNHTSHRVIEANLGTPNFMRAPGESVGSYALECAMDEMAYELKLDPVEFRLKNYADKDPEKGRPWSSKSLKQCYAQAGDRFGWSRRNPAPRSMRDGKTLIGWGMATSVYPTRRSASNARAELHADGTFIVDAGTQDIGTGTYTIMTQIAAATFGVPVSQVKFRLGDTVFPKTPVSGGSQTAASTGSAVYLAAKALQERLIQMAASDARSPLSGVSAQDVEFSQGRMVSKTAPSKSESYLDVIQRSGQPRIIAQAEAQPDEAGKKYAMYAFGAQFAEVRVDADLGQLRVSRLIGCFAAGKILNPKTARSQLLGGMAWGVSLALYENALLDKKLGRWVNNNLAEYHVPTNMDIADLQALWVEEKDTEVNPLGVKGIGEIGITGAGAAIANAVFHATGIRVRDLPITPDKLLSV
jgi:xanthine dehydrogenase YagR molybdenum-binding subunit